jgi:hypothetical protein
MLPVKTEYSKKGVPHQQLNGKNSLANPPNDLEITPIKGETLRRARNLSPR